MKQVSNRTVERDARKSGARPHRERAVARANTASGNVLRAHDLGNSTNVNAGGCLRPGAVVHA